MDTIALIFCGPLCAPSHRFVQLKLADRKSACWLILNKVMTEESVAEFRHSSAVRRTGLLMFSALTVCYLALAPGTIGGRGYIGEEIDSGNQIMVVFNAWVKGRPIPPMLWSRHGPVPVLFDI